MCLSKVTTIYDKPSDLILSGWKEFSGYPPQMRHQNFGGIVVMDTWLQASGGGIVASDGKKYEAGFHVYIDETEFKSKSGYRRVYYRRVTCVGDQSSKTCAVAQEMYVPSDPDGWPPQSAKPVSAPKKKLMDRLKGGGVQ